MAPVFTGSLPTKKKGDLQSLASALNISTEGTKEELQTRIKKYLDRNQAELEEDPHFSGLFDRRRKRKESVSSSKRSAVDGTNERLNGRRVVAMVPIHESTPAKDLSDVSAFLKNPPTSPSETEQSSSPNRRMITRSSLAIADIATDIPPSAETGTAVDQSLLDRTITSAPPVNSLLQILKRKQKAVAYRANKSLYLTRSFLSNARTIWTVSVLAQFLYIYVSVVPWQFLHIPFSATSTPALSDTPPPTVVPQPALSQSWNFISITIPYPPLGTFESHIFWTIVLHWFIPTVLIPVVAGVLISFRPPPLKPSTRAILSESREISRHVRGGDEEVEVEEETTQNHSAVAQLSALLDPLTASIVQLAAQIAYTFPSIHGPFSLSFHISPLITSIDVLGFKWRVLLASIGVAFSFAEALTGSLTSLPSRIPLKSPRYYEAFDIVDEVEVD
ncbi:hypothetical protein GGU11DRAFT_809753 [Lentinula aff. detonsa]|nr:hypothetical protein GGU11DRAFT_809753 [Lentinula aff. detonsa]